MSDETVVPYNMVYLQYWDENGAPQPEVTWCHHQISQTDVRYIRVGFILEALMATDPAAYERVVDITRRLHMLTRDDDGTI